MRRPCPWARQSWRHPSPRAAPRHTRQSSCSQQRTRRRGSRLPSRGLQRARPLGPQQLQQQRRQRQLLPPPPVLQRRRGASSPPPHSRSASLLRLLQLRLRRPLSLRPLLSLQATRRQHQQHRLTLVLPRPPSLLLPTLLYLPHLLPPMYRKCTRPHLRCRLRQTRAATLALLMLLLLLLLLLVMRRRRITS